MNEGNDVTESRGELAFHKLAQGFAIRDRLRDVLAEQQAIERRYRRGDNSDEYASRMVWTEWVLESDLDYTESALLTEECDEAEPATSTSTTPPTVTTPPAGKDNRA